MSTEMSTTSPQSNDAIRRAYVNLKALRDHVPSGYVQDMELIHIFNRSLEGLQGAGFDVNEWRLPGNIRHLTSNEFLAKIDAILMYFTFEQENVKMGFHR